jgi:hypothetical protein
MAVPADGFSPAALAAALTSATALTMNSLSSATLSLTMVTSARGAGGCNK